MRRVITAAAAMALVLCIVGQAWSNGRVEGRMEIAVSPSTLRLSVDQGGAVTVHTAIPYSLVSTVGLTLNGVLAQATWPDDRGHLVARFSESAVEATVAPPRAVLTLRGTMADGEPFAGSDEVRVIK